MVTGVTEGYQKTLEINGVGYRAAKSGKEFADYRLFTSGSLKDRKK